MSIAMDWLTASDVPIQCHKEACCSEVEEGAACEG